MSVVEGDFFERPSAGGGGLGDPLARDPQAVLEDVEDGYVTVRRAAIDYGVAIEEVDIDLAEYRVDEQATERLRAEQREARADKLDEDPEAVAERFRAGELDTMDLVRHYGVVLDWGNGELLSRTTEQFREMLRRRSAACWSAPAAGRDIRRRPDTRRGPVTLRRRIGSGAEGALPIPSRS